MSDQALVVQGKTATIPEYKISIALDTLDYDYIFQYKLWGGQELRGGVVVDWVVNTPSPVPMEYDGAHWHTGEASIEDRFQRARVAKHFGVAEVTVITGLEVDSDTPQEQVVSVVDAKLGRML